MYESNNPQCTLNEMLMAVAMSQIHFKTHVLFLPPGKEYTAMLTIAKNKKLIKPCGLTNYELTLKGWNRIKKHRNQEVTDIDKQIDKFVDEL